MENTALNRSLRALVHPLSWGAILLLLLNDHLWRWRWPSWWTGKAGDAAWLAFAPLVAAVLLALALPSRLRRRDAWVGGLSIGLVALLFTLVKACPAAHAAFYGLLQVVIGGAPLLVCDPSDLLALPVLCLSWRLWWATDPSPLRPPRRGWLALGLAALATVANAPAPDLGVAYLAARDEQIVAVAYYGRDRFASRDGGLTWTPDEGLPVYPDAMPAVGAWLYEVEGTGEVYRFMPALRIDRSTDGGSTWATEVDLSGGDARAAYYQAIHYTAMASRPGPLDAVYEPASGNLIVAMGWEGVLVRERGGQWRWVAVGRYHFEPLQRPDQIAVLLQGELWLALAAALLALSALGPGAQRAWSRVLLALLGLGWAAVTVIGKPATRSGYESLLTFVPSLVVLVAAVVLAIWQGLRLYRTSPRRLAAAGGIALGAALLFLVPFVLWGVGFLPGYEGAAWPAVLLALLVVLVGRRGLWTSRRQAGGS